jgi:hypothetical protein
VQVVDRIVYKDGRCYKIAKLFDVCTQRREKIAQETARLYRGGRYLGDCTIMYELDPALCKLLSPI